MEKMKPGVLRKLEEDYRTACNGWVLELSRLWGLDGLHGYWVGEEPGGVFDFDGAMTIGMEDIRYAVCHGVSHEQAVDWQEYVCWAGENGFDQPSLRDYCEARVPLVPREAQQRINNLRQDLMRLCAEERERMTSAFPSRGDLTKTLKTNDHEEA